MISNQPKITIDAFQKSRTPTDGDDTNIRCLYVYMYFILFFISFQVFSNLIWNDLRFVSIAYEDRNKIDMNLVLVWWVYSAARWPA